MSNTQGFYEIHVTVDCPASRLDEFKTICTHLGVKALIIDLGISQGVHVMTSKALQGTVQEASTSLLETVNGLSTFTILRKKIEASPETVLDLNIYYSYLEVHVPILDTLLYLLPESLKSVWFLSKNRNKDQDSILTRRVPLWADRYLLEEDCNLFKSLGILPAEYKLHFELAILDDNPSLDNTWITP